MSKKRTRAGTRRVKASTTGRGSSSRRAPTKRRTRRSPASSKPTTRQGRLGKSGYSKSELFAIAIENASPKELEKYLNTGLGRRYSELIETELSQRLPHTSKSRRRVYTPPPTSKPGDIGKSRSGSRSKTRKLSAKSRVSTREHEINSAALGEKIPIKITEMVFPTLLEIRSGRSQRSQILKKLRAMSKSEKAAFRQIWEDRLGDLFLIRLGTTVRDKDGDEISVPGKYKVTTDGRGFSLGRTEVSTFKDFTVHVADLFTHFSDAFDKYLKSAASGDVWGLSIESCAEQAA